MPLSLHFLSLTHSYTRIVSHFPLLLVLLCSSMRCAVLRCILRYYSVTARRRQQTILPLAAAICLCLCFCFSLWIFLRVVVAKRTIFSNLHVLFSNAAVRVSVVLTSHKRASRLRSSSRRVERFILSSLFSSLVVCIAIDSLLMLSCGIIL